MHVRVWNLDPASTRIILSMICLYKATRKMTAEGTIAPRVYSMSVVSRADTIVVRSNPLGV